MNLYDQTPWPGEACPQSHPDSVGAIARLFGLSSAPVERCRVLELGCAAGANLVPMAAAFPEARFVGVDLSAEQIRTGHAEVLALGLANLTLQTGDIAALPDDLGTFDYVIAHGVFSWVGRPVQDGLLRCMRSCLDENGVGFVSYVARPGSHPRQALREMLSWHVRGEADPKRKVERARRFAEQISMLADPRTPTLAATRRLVGELGAMSDGQVLHDYFAEHWEPLSLAEFTARAAEHQLQYLADAQFHTMFGEPLGPEALQVIREGAEDQVAFETTLDCFVHRPFRTSLLCHRARALDRSLGWQRVDGLHVSSQAQRDDREGVAWSFRTPAGDGFGTDSVLVGEALQRVTASWPRPMPFSALCGPGATDREALGANLLAAFSANQVQLGLGNRRIAHEPGERPRALASARAQATRGASATNLWHQTVALEPWQRTLLPLLNGAHDRAQLSTALVNRGHGDELPERLVSLAALAFLVA